MTLTEIKEKLLRTLEENKEEIFRIGDTVQQHPERGYTEEKTSALVRGVFETLSIPYDYPCAYTGVKGKIKGRKSLANVCIIGEMDALKCVGSPSADREGNAHACGHHAQIAAMLAAAIAFSKSGVMAALDGEVTFLAAPAEEFIDMEFRKSLKQDGKIRYYGGKQQLIAEGEFDDV